MQEIHAQLKNRPNSSKKTNVGITDIHEFSAQFITDCKNLNSYNKKIKNFIQEDKLLVTPDLIKDLLKNGSQKFAKNSLSKLLIKALKHDCKAIVELYIKINYLDIKDHNGYTPLLLACAEQEHAVAKWLIEAANVDINAITDEKLTPLMIAIYNNNKKLTNTLIKNGANLNLQDDIGDTALIIAAKCNYKDILIKLIKAGADQSIKNHSGHTAANISIINHIKKRVR